MDSISVDYIDYVLHLIQHTDYTNSIFLETNIAMTNEDKKLYLEYQKFIKKAKRIYHLFIVTTMA